MQTKKTILMIPSWYPSKEKPFQGTFFREQALILQEHYNFVVLRTVENKYFFLKYLLFMFLGKTKPSISFIKNDNGLQEYYLKFVSVKFFLIPYIIFKIKKRKGQIREGIGKLELKSENKIRFSNISRLYKKSLLPHFDCVYSLTTQDLVTLGKTFSDVYNVPHITAEHAPFPWPGTTLSDATVDAIESADAFLAISNDKIRQIAFQRVKLPRTFLVRNYCDESHFTLSKDNHTIKTFLIVAGNNLAKNYPLFFEAMEELNKIAEKDFKIIIAGYGASIGYDTHTEAFEKKVKELSIASKTTLIRSISREEIPHLYNKCDAFVLSSIEEGLPVCTLEAATSGLPIFSTRCGGVEDYVDDTIGRIVPISDYKGLANACNDFLNGDITFDNNYIRNKAVSLFGQAAFKKNMKLAFDYVMGKN
ncbi:Glycosyltransferase involved in cell wall bisynthesis [Treponema bryantii]|uniref:Glycosyltransferase involved in cell wall bisynthesis n=1 Tax=Treponema bryantii TaxID=163 RepID=A0A1H9J3N5_9SPIR|nr:glycosyltransferase [Treponema bryantii]SEQ81474.1 Glycosyltransferase involved in cell wall bisynthesis [Treponema bryantii]